MNSCQLIGWIGEHAKWIIGAQIVFHQKGKFSQIRQTGYILWMNTCRIEAVFIMWDAIVGMLHCGFQAVQLKVLDFVQAGSFDGVQSLNAICHKSLDLPRIRLQYPSATRIFPMSVPV